MNCESTIHVEQLLGKTLHTREASRHLFGFVAASPCDNIELDFLDVDYISRSFADEFHADKLKLATDHQKSIIVTNANDEIMNMLQSVARTQNKQYKPNTTKTVYRYSNWGPLESYLLSI